MAVTPSDHSGLTVAHAAHKIRKSGGKVKKKEGGKEKRERHNPKAFTFSGGINSVRRRAQRTLDLQTKREKAHLFQDKTPEDSPPPTIVVVQGPPGCGKSTLIQSLVKHYTKHNLPQVKGSVTVTAGKSRRITFVECKNDATVMLDLAKIADLVLLMIDASYGFEMETFEFLNILQVHGFPRILGILTHLDAFKETKTLRKTKKKFKNRFWAEIYDGAKLFYLSGLQYNRYNKTEILNLSRFISVQKIPVLSYRSQRPYLLALRYEDHTSPDEQKTSEVRRVHFYGYLKGAMLRSGSYVHIPGAGDYPVTDVIQYSDPCPLPVGRNPSKNDAGRQLRTLKTNERRIYAPGCDIGNVQYEADAIYIHLPHHQVGFTKKEDIEGDKSDRESTSTDMRSTTDDDDDDDYYNINHDKHTSDTLNNLPEAVRLVRTLHDANMALNHVVENQTLRLLPKSTYEATPLDENKLKSLQHRRQPVPEGYFKAHGNNNETSQYNDDDDSSSNDDADNNSDDNDETASSANDCNEAVAIDNMNISMNLDNSLSHSSNFLNDSDQDVNNDDDDDDDDNDDDNDDDDDDDDINNFDDNLNFDNEFLKAPRSRDFEKVCAKFKSIPTLTELIYSPHIQNISKSAVSNETKDYKLLFEDDNDDEEDDDDQNVSLIQRSLGDILYITPESMLLKDGDETSFTSNGDFQKLLTCNVNRNSSLHLNFLTSPEHKAYLKAARFITGGWDGDSPNDDDDDDTTKNEETNKNLEKHNTTTRLTPGRVDTEVTREREALRLRLEDERTKLQEAHNLIKEQHNAILVGTYVRIIIDGLPSKWVSHVTSIGKDVFLGGMLHGETGQNCQIQARIKRHRWSPKILKSNDALLISAGWRRFQALPMYCMEDRNNVRVRMLKYTPEHLHCLATFYGPLTAPGAGIIGIRNWESNVKNFRISSTGVVLESNADFKIVKKLKLVGEPLKIFKNTAFIQKMFNSDLEVSKCIGAKIQTVSGIRGQIKKPQGQDGTFRATFEDKILMSDIVLCKAWIKVEPKHFWNPVLDVPNWKRIRTIAEIRKDENLPLPDSKLSNYGKRPDRVLRRFNPLVIPKTVEKSLPFKSLPKNEHKKEKKSGLIEEATASTLTDYEKTVATLFNRLSLISETREKEKQLKLQKKVEAQQKAEAKIQNKRDVYTKDARKKRYIKQGMEQKKMRKRLKLED